MGKLIYLSHTKPEISYAVSTVSQFMQALYEEHMEVVNNIIEVYIELRLGRIGDWHNMYIIWDIVPRVAL